MKRTLFITVFVLALGSVSLVAQTRSGGYVSPVLEVSELEGNVAFGAGVELGVVQRRWHLGLYGVRTAKALRPGERAGELYHLQLMTGGISAAYLHPIAENIALSGGIRTAGGVIEREWLLSVDNNGTERTNVWLLTPEAGLSVSLSNRLQIGYTGGWRWAGYLESMPGIARKDLHSFTNTLTIKIGWLGSFKR
ncbi:MAG TPA: hypothetical protein PKC76_05840 [Saprospiraceae bacterium]|nr:hypothetical protein [Saprospiraceae bacterium]HMP23632.1 hypothetical protein [Saprospiraceae bacterium]